ncbi:hypothetical protein LTR56_023328 [Elasticomyces elasticus]|nr:hypothetical protein LTR56_023328 [Elasticomyces elasticus]KAK3625838.1 hypothetical protein LTR22_023405 [Elasticomyces elasticus]KAK4906818.1 hypothetical protein LTR49_024100 [Elasticomyces elasticus]KAK5755434.1 hypothetical protein LTS12_014419 [Elasticomyces elasticus]
MFSSTSTFGSTSAFGTNTPAPSTKVQDHAEAMAAVALAVHKLISAGDDKAADVIRQAGLEAFGREAFWEALEKAVEEVAE